MSDAELVHACITLMSGHRPIISPTMLMDALFVFGRAQEDWEGDADEEGILGLASWLWKCDAAHYIVLPGYDSTRNGAGELVSTGYPGWKRWRGELIRFDIPSTVIVSTRGEGTNTKTEGHDFVLLSRDKGWSSAVVVMHQHQVLRAMLGLVKSMKQLEHTMRVVPICPVQTNWTRPVYGSQGQKKLPRHEHIREEWVRILRYQEKGDLASFKELHAYLTYYVGNDK